MSDTQSVDRSGLGRRIQYASAAAVLAAVGVVSVAVQTSGSTQATGTATYAQALGDPNKVWVPAEVQGDGVLVAAVGDLSCDITDLSRRAGDYGKPDEYAGGPTGQVGGCRAKAVFDEIRAAHVSKFIALGDLQYVNASESDYAAVYDKDSASLKTKTLPVTGNHESMCNQDGTNPAQLLGGYWDYWNGDASSSTSLTQNLAGAYNGANTYPQWQAVLASGDPWPSVYINTSSTAVPKSTPPTVGTSDAFWHHTTVGPWASGTSYAVGDVVYLDEQRTSLWAAQVPNPTTKPATSTSADWKLLGSCMAIDHPANTYGAAGQVGKGYYEQQLAPGWSVYALNSACSTNLSGNGGTDCNPNGQQVQWFKTQLAADTNSCQIIATHHPRYSAGGADIGAANSQFVDEFWQVGYPKADVALAGHWHAYERFDPLKPAAPLGDGTSQLQTYTELNGSTQTTGVDGIPDAGGIREFVVGSGGENHHAVGAHASPAGSALVDTTHFGVLFLRLQPTGYKWAWVDDTGVTRDSGTGTCH